MFALVFSNLFRLIYYAILQDLRGLSITINMFLFTNAFLILKKRIQTFSLCMLSGIKHVCAKLLKRLFECFTMISRVYILPTCVYSRLINSVTDEAKPKKNTCP